MKSRAGQVQDTAVTANYGPIDKKPRANIDGHPNIIIYLLFLATTFGLFSLECQAATSCGQDGQRACCAGTFEYASGGFSCTQGTVEVSGCTGNCQCGGFNPFGWFNSLGTCKSVSACGGEGQRACCSGLTEYASGGTSCNADLVEVSGCTGNCLCGGIGTGQNALGTCVKPTACGGKGQRACCVGTLEYVSGTSASCQAGLIEAPGCTGDCFCGGPSASGQLSSGMCTVKETIAEPGINIVGERIPPSVSDPYRGYADLHLHMFANLGMGGGVLSGAAYDPVNGVNEALRPDYATTLDLVKKDGTELPDANDGLLPECPENLYSPYCNGRVFHGDHTLVDDPVGVAGTGDVAKSNFGAPLFSGWPRAQSTTHQQVYFKWLERANAGGLRLVVLLAVTNEAMCKGNKHLRNVNCEDSMAAIDQQIQAAYDFEAWLDAQSGGPGSGWFRIVKTPQEAREVVRQGKLAVVMGIEVDNLFNCKFINDCNEQYIVAQMQKYYDLGIRHIFPVHNFDNGFGGAATWMDSINVGNRVSEGHYYLATECANYGYNFKLDSVVSAIINLFGFGNFEYPLPYTQVATCNQIGLSLLGKFLVQELMSKKIMIDIDHMSNKSISDTLALASNSGYPLVSSHTLFFDLNEARYRHERMRTRAQLVSLNSINSMIAPMLKDDQQDVSGNTGLKTNLPYVAGSNLYNRIVDDCRHSTRSWAQTYLYGVDVMGGRVGLGSDFNGIAGHIGPRFGSGGCGGVDAPGSGAERSAQIRHGDRLVYPFTLEGFGTFDKQVTGQRTFDFNTDGLAHVGLLPDMVADLKAIGLTNKDLEPLFHSAENYIKMWELVETTNVSVTPADSTAPIASAVITPSANANSWYGDIAAVQATITAADEADGSGLKSIYYSMSGAQVASNEVSGVSTVGVTITAEGVTELSYSAQDLAGNASLAEVSTVHIDRTRPEITASVTPAANSHYWINSVPVTVQFTASDALSGIAQGSVSPALALSTEGGGQAVVGTATDLAGNIGQVTSYVSIDVTAPQITPTRVPTPNAKGWNNTDVALNFSATDAFAGFAPNIISSASYSFSAEGMAQGATWSITDLADNTASLTVNDINIDKTKPTVTAVLASQPNSLGWYNSDVQAVFTCGDALSGIASCGPAQTLSVDGINQSVTGSAVDNADNTTSTVIANINIDKTPPVVTVTGVADGMTYILGAVPVAGCITDDALSGVATQASLSVTGGTANNVGEFTATCAGAMDVADNAGQTTAVYYVHYDYSGFFPPIANQPSVNTVRAGQAIPVKFNLGADFGLDILVANSPESQQTQCDSGAAVNDVLETVTAGNSSLVYDATAEQYVYSWKTQASWSGTCRRLSVKLDDGTSREAMFKFK